MSGSLFETQCIYDSVVTLINVSDYLANGLLLEYRVDYRANEVRVSVKVKGSDIAR